MHDSPDDPIGFRFLECLRSHAVCGVVNRHPQPCLRFTAKTSAFECQCHDQARAVIEHLQRIWVPWSVRTRIRADANYGHRLFDVEGAPIFPQRGKAEDGEGGEQKPPWSTITGGRGQEYRNGDRVARQPSVLEARHEWLNLMMGHALGVGGNDHPLDDRLLMDVDLSLGGQRWNPLTAPTAEVGDVLAAIREALDEASESVGVRLRPSIYASGSRGLWIVLPMSEPVPREWLQALHGVISDGLMRADVPVAMEPDVVSTSRVLCRVVWSPHPGTGMFARWLSTDGSVAADQLGFLDSVPVTDVGGLVLQPAFPEAARATTGPLPPQGTTAPISGDSLNEVMWHPPSTTTTTATSLSIPGVLAAQHDADAAERQQHSSPWLLDDKIAEIKTGRPYTDVDLTNWRNILPATILRNHEQLYKDKALHMAMAVMQRQLGRVDAEALVAEVRKRIHPKKNKTAVEKGVDSILHRVRGWTSDLLESGGYYAPRPVTTADLEWCESIVSEMAARYKGRGICPDWARVLRVLQYLVVSGGGRRSLEVSCYRMALALGEIPYGTPEGSRASNAAVDRMGVSLRWLVDADLRDAHNLGGEPTLSRVMRGFKSVNDGPNHGSVYRWQVPPPSVTGVCDAERCKHAYVSWLAEWLRQAIPLRTVLTPAESLVVVIGTGTTGGLLEPVAMLGDSPLLRSDGPARSASWIPSGGPLLAVVVPHVRSPFGGNAHRGTLCRRHLPDAPV